MIINCFPLIHFTCKWKIICRQREKDEVILVIYYIVVRLLLPSVFPYLSPPVGRVSY